MLSSMPDPFAFADRRNERLRQNAEHSPQTSPPSSPGTHLKEFIVLSIRRCSTQTIRRRFLLLKKKNGRVRSISIVLSAWFEWHWRRRAGPRYRWSTYRHYGKSNQMRTHWNPIVMAIKPHLDNRIFLIFPLRVTVFLNFFWLTCHGYILLVTRKSHLHSVILTCLMQKCTLLARVVLTSAMLGTSVSN
jgi:hypothetical protein